MKNLIILMIILCLIFYCNFKENQSISNMSNSEIELIMTVYHRAWNDGANASTHAYDNMIPFGPKIGAEILKKDSLAFIGELYHTK